MGMWTANNFGDPKSLKVWGLHADGRVTHTTMKFKADSAYTIQEFGWLRENWFYMVTIEGECGKSKKLENRGHTTGALVIEAPGRRLPADTTMDEDTGSMKWVWMDQAEDENNVSLPDGFFMMDRTNMALFLLAPMILSQVGLGNKMHNRNGSAPSCQNQFRNLTCPTTVFHLIKSACSLLSRMEQTSKFKLQASLTQESNISGCWLG